MNSDGRERGRMTSEEYIRKRLEDQIGWYDRKSITSQRNFKRMRVAEIIAAALIPFLSGLALSKPEFHLVGTVAVGLLGMGIAIIAGILALGQHHEHWIEYRTVSESLKKEKFLYQTQVEPYDGDDAFGMLVQRVETLVSKENTNWAQYMMKPEQKKAEPRE
jgi:hypothetical protein